MKKLFFAAIPMTAALFAGVPGANAAEPTPVDPDFSVATIDPEFSMISARKLIIQNSIYQAEAAAGHKLFWVTYPEPNYAVIYQAQTFDPDTDNDAFQSLITVLKDNGFSQVGAVAPALVAEQPAD
ncbi:MAG: hypothetical protein QP744_03550 [Winkia sp. UMB750A]|uniref:hypothetical protein n=1 Tax=unclassified Winkia TaxID=2692119 RepID=UPI002553D65A|nr:MULTISPECIES: hypothetical protein [unclassified Winkia]MDK8225084.1 hypothetical protein [Winkia sp. UMB750B]MDK8256538.1 hypothetical protein [Winkia sp. UMB750A]